jgi:DHA1 family tetracycline resistance protein-like MFS transporter
MSEPASAQAADTLPVRSGAAAFIFVTILLDMLALGLILPILPKLVESFVDNDTATAARVFGLFGTAWALMQFLFSPILGALSDRFGRRPVVLLSNFGLALDYVLMALAPSLVWLFIGRVISGITSASISTAFAYIADVTPPERRAAVFGKIGAAFGAGFILGPAIGGLLGGMDPRLPFWIAAGLSFANTLYGWLILPESLPPERRAPFRWKSASPLGALHLLRSNRILAGLSLANFFGQVAHVVLPSTFVLYATYRYGWDTTTVGLTLALVGVCAMVVQGAGVGPIVKRLGERRALLLGLASGALGFFIYGAAPTGPLFWIGIPVMALWGVAGAAIQALTTQLVAPDQQGQLQGATNSVNSIAQMLGPFLFTLTFAYFISDQAPVKMPGAPFLLAAALLGLGLLIAWRTLAPKRWIRRVGKAQRAHHINDGARNGGHGANATLPTLLFLLLHQRAVAGLKRLSRIFRRDRSKQLVIVPRALRFFRLLHLEQIGRDQTAAVGADRAVAEQRVVGREFLHLGHHLGAVMRITAECFQRLQVMRDSRIVASLRHRRLGMVGCLFLEFCRPSAGLVVQVPVEGLGEGQALCGLQAERMHVVDEQ